MIAKIPKNTQFFHFMEEKKIADLKNRPRILIPF
jgi:hypothetical protein